MYRVEGRGPRLYVLVGVVGSRVEIYRVGCRV